MFRFLMVSFILVVMATCLFLRYLYMKGQRKMSNDEIPVKNVKFKNNCII